MSFLVALAKFAVFTDAFLSGLVIPLIPTIIENGTRVHYSHQQLQMWTSVVVSAHGGAFALVSPTMPLYMRRGPSSYAVLLVGLALSAGAFSLLHLPPDPVILFLGRFMQGILAAGITAASSGMLATAASSNGPTCGLTWVTPTLIQNVAMTAAPIVAGFLQEYYGTDAVFYCGYALVTLSILLVLVAVNNIPVFDSEHNERPDVQPRGYGTMPSGTGESSRRSSRSISPRTAIPTRSSQRDALETLPAATSGGSRLSVALFGYLVVGLLISALQSVLPLFVKRHFNWSALATGSLFVPLSAPAALIGPLAGALAIRVPRSTRFLTTIGFFACLPAFLYLGELRDNTKIVQHGFLLMLGCLSLATGLCGDPLVEEIINTAASSGSDRWWATAQATSLPSATYAWGSLVGPLFASAVSWLWGWSTMNKSLAVVAAAAGVVSLFFLQGWTGRPYPDIQSRHAEPTSDEESAPLLANDRSNRGLYGQPEAYSSKREDGYCRQSQDSEDLSPSTHSGKDRMSRPHRRHFSVDNFSVATTAGPGSVDSSTSSVRFQAALETPVHGSLGNGAKRASMSDNASKTSAERRYIMREAPHAPATDPLLAAGSLYVIDEERDTAAGVQSERQKRRVVVFAEGMAPPELLKRHRHHTVAINAIHGTAQMVSDSTDDHAVHVTEESGEEEPDFSEATSRRYVVVVVESEDDESK
ncbi:major facilitator superfamily domain-containing protein [Achaetomium macrosporum]|uniref:Major facilitator superfamily domain-containing protein n=1 Tax=Achaetomium macrosporum TaxID=79813 RepID=A0AAN7C1C7_9PEZI|nr:major facilitator superfamily domain-containing protein [Achaetomium macrosporum]